jgi:hypothetical protein
LLIAQLAGRLGLSMAGAMCGRFVATQLTMTDAALFDSADFVALMVLVGIPGFDLCLARPWSRVNGSSRRIPCCASAFRHKA